MKAYEGFLPKGSDVGPRQVYVYDEHGDGGPLEHHVRHSPDGVVSRHVRIVFEDDTEGFGVIAWISGFIFFAYAAAIVICLLTHSR